SWRESRRPTCSASRAVSILWAGAAPETGRGAAPAALPESAAGPSPTLRARGGTPAGSIFKGRGDAVKSGSPLPAPSSAAFPSPLLRQIRFGLDAATCPTEISALAPNDRSAPARAIGGVPTGASASTLRDVSISAGALGESARRASIGAVATVATPAT